MSVMRILANGVSFTSPPDGIVESLRLSHDRVKSAILNVSLAADGSKKPSLFQRAFWNQYNFIMLGAAGLFSVATFTWIPLLIGAGVEVLWLVLGSDSAPFKRWVTIQEGLE